MARAVRGLIEFMSGMMVGIAMGYAAALLLAPAEGDENRARVREGAEAIRETPHQVAEQVQSRVQQAVEQGRRVASEARTELESVAGLDRAPAAAPPAVGDQTGVI